MRRHLAKWAVITVCFLAAVWTLRHSQDVSAASPADTPAEAKAYVETIPDTDVQFEMVPVPGGTFKMGSPANEPGRSDDEGPQHPVTIRPFWMGKTEVTWDEYDLFRLKEPPVPATGQMAADAVTRPTPPYADETFGFPREGNPVISITHHAAMEYCAWLSAKTGKS